MIYTDGKHLAAESLSELCAYAQKVGLDSSFLLAGKRNLHPHFLICGKVKDRILRDEEVQTITTRQLIAVYHRFFPSPVSIADLQKENLTHLLPSHTDYERMMNNIFNRAGIKR